MNQNTVQVNLLGLRISLLKIEIWLKPLEENINKTNQGLAQTGHSRVGAFRAATLLIGTPLKLLTAALLAKVTGEWADL